MSEEQKDFLISVYKRNNMDRGELLRVFPHLIPILFDFTKPLKLIDLSYMKCIYNYPNATVCKNGSMWGKEYDVDFINGRAQFNYERRRYETDIIFFEPNNL